MTGPGQPIQRLLIAHFWHSEAVTRPARLAGLLLAVCVGAAVTACGQVSERRPAPRPTPVHLAFGVLPLGGVSPTALTIAGPYAAAPTLPAVPKRVRAARVPGTATVHLADLAHALGVPGPPINTGDGLAYNLGATTGYQLTGTPNALDFNFHPNTPVDETGATPSVASANGFVEQFLAAHHLPGPNEGLEPLAQLTTAHAADRRVFFQWTEDGYPLVDINGIPQEFFADVAANYRDQLSLVGLSGAVPQPISGSPAEYPATSTRLLVSDLNRGLLTPEAYLLQADGQPYPAEPAGVGSAAATLTGWSLAVVNSAGYAVPVLVLQVAGRPPLTEFVMCAAATNACAPLRYSTAGTTPSP